MTDFSTDIQNFERYGSYTYTFDDVGNLTFNSSSAIFTQVYLAMPLNTIKYNNSKIQSFYDVNFEEFVPTLAENLEISSSNTIDSLQEQIGMMQQENMSLQSQLSDLIILNEASSSAATNLATKQVILELRIALGQGRIDSDFSNDFPYTPVTDMSVTQSLS